MAAESVGVMPVSAWSAGLSLLSSVKPEASQGLSAALQSSGDFHSTAQVCLPRCRDRVARVRVAYEIWPARPTTLLAQYLVSIGVTAAHYLRHGQDPFRIAHGPSGKYSVRSADRDRPVTPRRVLSAATGLPAAAA